MALNSGEDRKYLVVARLAEKDVQANLKRVQSAKEIATEVSKGRYQMAFSSADGSLLGLFIESHLAAAQVRARFDAVIQDQDRVFVWVIELGEDFSATGNSRGWQWLQHH